MIARNDELTETENLVINVATQMDRRFSKFGDSCLSELYIESSAIYKKFEGVALVEAKPQIIKALQFKAIDYYRKHHGRHSQRQLVKDLTLVTSCASEHPSFAIDLDSFETLLSENERVVWPVVTKQLKGDEVALMLGVSAQAVSKRQISLKQKAKRFFKDYKHDRS